MIYITEASFNQMTPELCHGYYATLKLPRLPDKLQDINLIFPKLDLQIYGPFPDTKFNSSVLELEAVLKAFDAGASRIYTDSYSSINGHFTSSRYDWQTYNPATDRPFKKETFVNSGTNFMANRLKDYGYNDLFTMKEIIKPLCPLTKPFHDFLHGILTQMYVLHKVNNLVIAS